MIFRMKPSKERPYRKVRTRSIARDSSDLRGVRDRASHVDRLDVVLFAAPKIERVSQKRVWSAPSSNWIAPSDSRSSCSMKPRAACTRKTTANRKRACRTSSSSRSRNMTSPKRFASRIACDVPITPRAAGSGRTGGAVPVAGGIVLATHALQAHRSTSTKKISSQSSSPASSSATFHETCEREGIFYAPDPNSADMCMIGGNVAENAGGPRAFKYGSTRDHVLGLEA